MDNLKQLIALVGPNNIGQYLNHFTSMMVGGSVRIPIAAAAAAAAPDGGAAMLHQRKMTSLCCPT